MLVRTEDNQIPDPPEERAVGDLVHDLVENGKAYARAEVAVAKATAAAKAKGLRLPAILFGSAFLVIQAAVVVLGIGIMHGLEPLVGPVLAGLLVFVLMAGLAGLLGYMGAKRLGDG